MPKTEEEKRLDSIRRIFKHWGDDFEKIPYQNRSIIRNTYSKLSLSGQATIAAEFKLNPKWMF